MTRKYIEVENFRVIFSLFFRFRVLQLPLSRCDRITVFILCSVDSVSTSRYSDLRSAIVWLRTCRSTTPI